MNNKPMILTNDDMAEGIYAASGAICWTGSIKTTQDYNGQAHVYEVSLWHTKAVTHFSEACTVRYTFSQPVTNAWAEGSGNYNVDYTGYVVTVTRIHHANGEYSGDSVTYKLFVNAANQDLTKALGDPKMEILSCEKTGTPNYPNID